jgi:hypothetical protein
VLNIKANFLVTSQPYILYLSEYLNVHDLWKMSFQHLDPKVATRNGGKGVTSIIQSAIMILSPHDDTLTLKTRRTQENEDGIVDAELRVEHYHSTKVVLIC